MKGCECEHFSHFPPDVGDTLPPTKHPYGDQKFRGNYHEVKTIYGTVRVCAACLRDHPFPDSLLDKEGKGANA